MRQFAVILPTYNEMNTDFIQKSVPLLTSFPHLHVIAVDKGSQDGTLEWLKQFKVQILHSDAQMRAQRLNQGILASTSEWILLHHPRSIIDKNG
ncbi:MAG: glycosyltransferase, partial [Bdellovibrionales bacterium]|nr:glycosyltransferase [Bdellovibrionales bacterium]